MSRYNGKHSIVTKQSDEDNGDYWFQQFEKNLVKDAVQPLRDMQYSIHDQINSIMNGTKSKYTSVEAAVEDMKNRSGLSAYLEKTKSQKVVLSKQASLTEEESEHVANLKDAINSQNWYLAGFVSGRFNKRNGGLTTGINSIQALQNSQYADLANVNVPSDHWLDYTMGYSAGADYSLELSKKNSKHTLKVLQDTKRKFAQITTSPSNIEPETASIDNLLEKINFLASEKPESEKTLVSKLKNAMIQRDWHEFGFLMGQQDASKGVWMQSAESIRNLKNFPDQVVAMVKIPYDLWPEYAIGYADGARFTPEKAKQDYLFTIKVINNLKLKKSASSPSNKKIDTTPIVIKKYPAILNTFENYIRDSKGNLSVPAIIEHVKSIHYNDCSDTKDWDDTMLIRLVSKLNLQAKSDNPSSYEIYNNLGSKDYSQDIDMANSDAFIGLTPAKIN